MKKDSLKLDRLKTSIFRHGFGIVGLSEVGVNWNRIPQKDGWWSRSHHWFTSLRSSKSYNTTDKAMGRAQAGGTLTFARDRYAHCTDRIGFDPRNLGRWSSVRLQGKGAIRTRIVTVYCPCPSSITHQYSTYNQHIRHLAASNIHKCPRQVFWDDLLAELDSFKAAGEQLIVMGDWNHPIAFVQDKLSALGLSDAILSLHQDSTPPATHNRGRNVIDGIFVTASLRPTAGGFCVFNKILLSDHRALWVDIPLTALLGFEMPNIVTPSARRLKLNDPRVVSKYFQYLVPFLHQHDLFNRAAALLQRTVFPLPPTLAAEYESIHSLCTEGMLQAERQCRQLYRGAHPWSLEFAKAQSTVVFWTLCSQKVSGLKVDTKKMLRIGKRLGLAPTPEISISEAYEEKDKAWERYKLTKGNSSDLRWGFIESLANAQAQAGNIPMETRLRALLSQEDQRRASRAIRKTTDKLQAGGTSRVLTKDSEGRPIEITEKVPMEKVIADVHEEKFHSSEKYCPLMSGQLFQDIGSLGFGPRVQDILDGTYVPPADTPRGTKLFLKHMARPHMPVPIPSDSVASFRARWKRTKESTSSSSALHFGHYKAGSSHDLVGWLLYMLAEIPFVSGYAPTAWQEGIDVVILKAANDFRIEKMRTIVLYHPEFNMNNKRLGWEAMHVAIKNKQLAIEQYSRPGRSAIDHVVNRQLSFNHFIYQRRPFGVCSCDLTGCYDRVVHSAISIAMQRLGFKPGAIQSQFDNIQKLIHKVRTVFGDSDISYGGNTWRDFFLHPPQGFGQGNCFGPPGWAILSSTIFAILKDEGYGVQFCSALSKAAFELCGFAYVDDADLLQTGHCAKEVSKNLQAALTTWEEVINATGGAMAPSKSWWYLIDIVWKRGKFSLADGGQKGDLIAHDENGNAVSLEYLMCSQATKMLGVWLAPDGNHITQVEQMKQKAADWADFIRSGHLSPVDTWVALSTTIWKTLEYPLPALMLTDKDIHSIIWPVISIVLPRMGMSRNLSKSLRYGPLSVGGVGIRNLYLVMGMARLHYLLEHPWKGTPTGDLITSNWESFSLEAGLFGSLFDADFDSLSTWLLTPDTWVRATLSFIKQQKISFGSSSFYTLEPKRLHDSPIMSGLARITDSQAELRRLNQCRIFLRVVGVADISNAVGTSISHIHFGSHQASPYRSLRRNCYQWPAQECPPPSDWTLWRASIKAAFCTNNWDLRIPLGDWTSTRSAYFSDWDYFLQLKPLRLFAFNGKKWSTYKRAPVRPRSRTASFFYRGYYCDPPQLSSLRRTTITKRGPSTFSVEYFTLLETVIEPWVDQLAPPADPVNAFFYYLHRCKEFAWIASDFEHSPNIDKLLIDFKAGTLLSVSDGSYSPDRKAGASAWCVESIDGTQYIRGGGRTPGARGSQGAYRSELAGLLGLSMVLWSFEQALLLQNALPPELIIGCDGISALFKSITKDKERLYMRDKDFDIISAIIGYWNAMRSDPFPVHIPGHQDDHIDLDDLPRLARMNVKTDSMAKAILARSLSDGHPAPFPAYSFALPIVYCHDVPIESCFAKSAVELISTLDARAYWIDKTGLSPRLAVFIDWTAFGRAFKGLSFSRQTFIRKWLSSTIPVGTTLRKRKCGTDNRCPRCNCYDESPQHVITCPHRDASAHRAALFNALVSSLEDMDTCPLLIASFKQVLVQWLRSPNRFVLHLSEIDPCLHQCFAQQDSMGWYNFFCGFLSSQFTSHQHSFYASKRSKKSAPLWASKLTRALWNFIHELWEHRNSLKYAVNDLAPDSPEVCALRSAALLELDQDVSCLPVIYRRYFALTPASLLSMSNTDLRMWFKTIRTFRESTSTSVVDVFSTPGPFRTWVGLGPLRVTAAPTPPVNA